MKQQPNWQPISQLPLIANMMDGQLETVEEQYGNLLKAKDRPHVLDDYDIQRIIRVYTEQAEFIEVYEKQLQRWYKKVEKLTPAQRHEIERLQKQITPWRRVVTDILELAKELEKGTIDKVMAKSDLELGLEALLKGKF